MKQHTTCPYCGVGCGVTAELADNRLIAVSGDSQHPANFGRLCIKGLTLPETVTADARLQLPRLHGQAVSWDDAMTQLSQAITEALESHGPDSIAFYLSGQLLTEDYYVANKLMKGFLGSSQVDTNSRLCMASTVAGHKRAFGADAVPGCYADIELANLVILAGSNAAWNHPILYQRIQAARQARPTVKVVVIDPRTTASCDIADLHLALRPGTDALLFNALLVYLADQGCLDQQYIEQHTQGFDETLQQARQASPNLQQAAQQTDLPLEDLTRFCEWFASTDKTLSLFSQGINQSSSGTDKVNSLINCHLATGRVGKPGSSPLSLTGQPNAMGGREVGGLANQLAAHMDFTPEHIDRVRRFWNAPNMATAPGRKAIDLFHAVERGEIKVLWIMGTNPLVSLPDTERVKRALKRCEWLVVSEPMASTDTLNLADLCLPSTTWGEKNGTVTNSERRISRQQPLLSAPGEARQDWQILCDLAQRLGFGNAFNYQHPADIFIEHAALSGFENQGSRCFDISGLSQLDQHAYDRLQPIQWPVTTATPYGTQRLFSENRFYTPSGKAHFIPVQFRAPEQTLNDNYPLRLNTGRIRDQWHTMTRTGRSERLFQHRSEPFIDLHPQDASARQISTGDLAQVENQQGRYIGRVRLTTDQRPGEVFIPMHWNHQFSAQGRCNALIQPVTDPVSGQPESKQGAVEVHRFPARWHGQLLTRDNISSQLRGYWSRQPLTPCQQYILAETDWPGDWSNWCLQHLGQRPDGYLENPITGQLQAYATEQQRLKWWLLITPTYQPADLRQMAALFESPSLTPSQRGRLLHGLDSPQHTQVCSCHQVDEQRIREAIQSGCRSVTELGDRLSCGTRCGSCIPELKALLAQEVEHATVDLD